VHYNWNQQIKVGFGNEVTIHERITKSVNYANSWGMLQMKRYQLQLKRYFAETKRTVASTLSSNIDSNIIICICE
jgi:hypothetical protein